MASKKYKITQLQNDDSLLELRPETDADIVNVETGTGKYQGQATNVQDALEEVYDLASTGGVTGVKGNAETNYRTGNVNLTPANIGAQASFSDGTATIASESQGVVTLVTSVEQSSGTISAGSSSVTLKTSAKIDTLLSDKADKSATVSTISYDTTNKKITKTINGTTSDVVSATTLKTDMALNNVTNNAQIKGLASGTTSGDIVTFGADGYTVADSGKSFSTSAPTSSSTDTQIPTAKAVDTAITTAINNLPQPMVFKGTLGTGGTITTLPTASSSNEGYTYKVITAGTYASQSAKVGDLFVSNGTNWVIIPAGDETQTEDTWRGIKVNDTLLLGNAINTGAVNYKNGTYISITGSGNDVTISSTLTNKTASSAGTDVSLVTTGEKYTWNNKGTYSKPSTGIPASDLEESYYLASNPNGYTSNTGTVTKVDSASGSHLSVSNKTTTPSISVESGYSIPSTTNQTTWSNKYDKPGTGIPKTDLASAVQTSLGKADSAMQSLTISGDASGTAIVSSGAGTLTLTLGNSGVTAGTYSVVQVNAKGLVTAGNQILEVGATSQTTPSSSLAVGGIFFKEI